MMTIGTLAQPYAWDGSWKKGDGTNKGSWVYDSSWKQIKELYVWDNGSWKLNIPVHGVSCVIATQSNGTCGAVNASYLIQSTWFGPMPQNNGTDQYQVEHWDRTSFTALGLFSAPWILQRTTSLSTSFISPIPIFFNFVIGAGTTRKWHQAQARLTHTVYGDVPLASGGIVSSISRNFYINDCDIE